MRVWRFRLAAHEEREREGGHHGGAKRGVDSSGNKKLTGHDRRLNTVNILRPAASIGLPGLNDRNLHGAGSQLVHGGQDGEGGYQPPGGCQAADGRPTSRRGLVPC